MYLQDDTESDQDVDKAPCTRDVQGTEIDAAGAGIGFGAGGIPIGPPGPVSSAGPCGPGAYADAKLATDLFYATSPPTPSPSPPPPRPAEPATTTLKRKAHAVVGSAQDHVQPPKKRVRRKHHTLTSVADITPDMGKALMAAETRRRRSTSVSPQKKSKGQTTGNGSGRPRNYERSSGHQQERKAKATAKASEKSNTPAAQRKRIKKAEAEKAKKEKADAEAKHQAVKRQYLAGNYFVLKDEGKGAVDTLLKDGTVKALVRQTPALPRGCG